MHFILKHKWFFLLLVFVLFWIIFVSPEKVVSFLGVERGYLLIFLLALLGVSGFSSAPFYTILLTFVASGEFNIFLLALVASPAMAIGDSLFFFLGYKGHVVFGGRLRDVSLWLKSKPPWVTPLFAYFYSSFAPLPQDFLMVVLGLIRARFVYIIIALLLGNATFVIFTSNIFLKLTNM